MKIGIEESIKKKSVKVRRRKIGEKWDAEYRRMKRKVKKAYRR